MLAVSRKLSHTLSKLPPRAQHSASLQREACRLLGEQIDSASCRQSFCAELVDAGAFVAATRALLRHLASPSLCAASLRLLAGMCRWQPKAALLLRGSGAVESALRLVEGGLSSPAFAAVEMIHWAALAQHLLASALPSPSPYPRPPLVEPMAAGRALLQLLHLSNGKEGMAEQGEEDAEKEGASELSDRSAKLAGEHARRALCWLLCFAPSERERLHAVEGGEGVEQALAESLAPDLSLLSSESIASALSPHPAGPQLLRDAAAELHSRLSPNPPSPPLLLPSQPLALRLISPCLSALDGKDTHDPHVASAACSVLGLFSRLSADKGANEALAAGGVVGALLPFMVAPSPPRLGLAHAAALLANMLGLREGVGTLQQRAEESKRARCAVCGSLRGMCRHEAPRWAEDGGAVGKMFRGRGGGFKRIPDVEKG